MSRTPSWAARLRGAFATATPRELLLQGIAIGIVIAIVAVIASTTAANLRARGIPLGTDFLHDRAGFSIAESVLAYSRDDSNLRAIIVGIGNTLFVSAAVIVLSTVLGTFVALGRLSPNPLLAALARMWIESARNTPLVLILIFLYALWWQLLPTDAARPLLPGVLASIRGIAVPEPNLGIGGGALLGWLAVVMTALLGAARLATRHAALRGRRPPYVSLTTAVLAVATTGLLLGFADVRFTLPQAHGPDLVRGFVISPEIAMLLVGLVFYTVGFVAEIVRSGIAAVPRGQWEAARALGLAPRDVLARVVMPQMLRVVVPPMTSQYINVVKNSTLALAIGYSDFMTVMGTIINKTSHAIEGTLIIVGVYLLINFSMSLLLNWFNRRVAIPER